MVANVKKSTEIIIFHRSDIEKNTVKSVHFSPLRDFSRDRARRIDPRVLLGAALGREKRSAARGGGRSRYEKSVHKSMLDFCLYI